MCVSQAAFPITAIPTCFKTVGEASGTLFSSADSELSQELLDEVWELAWAWDVHNRQLECGYSVFKEKTVEQHYVEVIACLSARELFWACLDQ